MTINKIEGFKMSDYLTGKYFHIVKENVVQTQGVIIEPIANNLVICQLFSFMSGEPTDIVVINLAEFQYKSDNGLNGIVFYPSSSDMNKRYHSHWQKTPQAISLFSV